MRPRSLAFLAAIVLAAGACNAVFGIEPGTLAENGGSTSSTSSTSSTGTTSSTTSSSGTGGTGGTGGGAVATGRISVGHGRACAVGDSGSVACWGFNDGAVWTDPRSLLPTATAAPSQVPAAKQVSVGWDQSCVLDDAGAVTCWGNAYDGELGVANPPYETPVQVMGLPSPAVELSATYGCSCARLQNGEVWCWGEQSFGCAGTGLSAKKQLGPTKVAGLAGAVQLRTGDASPACALLSSGHVSCWAPGKAAAELSGVTDAVDLAVGNGYVFLRDSAGAITYTGLDPSSHTWISRMSYALSGAKPALMAAGNQLCVVRSDNTVGCADITGHPPLPPLTAVTNVPQETIEEISVGSGTDITYYLSTNCIRTSGTPLAGHVYCWGDDYALTVGANAPEVALTPGTPISFASPVQTLTTGTRSTSVVLMTQTAWSWGAPGVVSPSSAMPASKPAQVMLFSNDNLRVRRDDHTQNAYDLKAAGGAALLLEDDLPMPLVRLLAQSNKAYTDALPFPNFDVGLLASGDVMVWPYDATSNADGIFGDSTTAVVDMLHKVPLDGPALAIAAHGDPDHPSPAHACAILASTNALQCWGSNDYGEAGAGSMAPIVPVTTVIFPIAGEKIVSVAVGERFSCAVSMAGNLYCWGANDNAQLGTEGLPPSDTPVQILGLPQPAAGVTAFGAHACAWLTDGTGWCWGDNDLGQLGNGSMSPVSSIQQVIGLTSAAEIVTSDAHTCAVLKDGTVQCWGSSYYGQGGTGKTGIYPSPTPVVGL